jgi:peptidyl-prolyl cis-trans isomerase C
LDHFRLLFTVHYPLLKENRMEWKASHILVKDRAQAQELLKRIKQGADFASLARENSTCPSKSAGGDLGWFGPGKMVAPFEAACKSLGVGSVSDVVQTQFGYHLVKVTGKRD